MPELIVPVVSTPTMTIVIQAIRRKIYSEHRTFRLRVPGWYTSMLDEV